MEHYIKWLHELGMDDLDQVGGKNASLGEMISQLSGMGVAVPGGFATTAHAFRDFLAQSGLAQKIQRTLEALNVDNLAALASAGKEIRRWILETPFPVRLDQAIEQAWKQLCADAGGEPAVAVRSSATAEDLPDASFAGQQETFLNVRGLQQVKARMHEVFASLYNDRAISYRVHQGFTHSDVALSAGVQIMVRSDLGTSGVMFTLDTESGFRDAVFITASWGLGETVVQGAVNPDEFYVYKPALASGHDPILRRNRGAKAIEMVYSDSGRGVETRPVDLERTLRFCLSDSEVISLARQAVTIEQHYGKPMDIEWAKDGESGELYIVQARPETVRSRSGKVVERYRLKQEGVLLCTGRSIGQRIGAGTARVVTSIADIDRVGPGDVLVTDMTDPDWEPIMKRAAAIVTNRGGRTCHAAIIARELGIPAVVGCGDATEQIPADKDVTVSCAQGDSGFVYAGRLEFEQSADSFQDMPPAPLKIMMNVGNPDRAFDFSRIPNAGVGLARLEFIINRMIGVHPKALLEYASLDAATQQEVDHKVAGYADPVSYYVNRLSEGIATIAAAFAPNPVIVRLSDFKSNEYANLIGGGKYEPHEENPMLGFRGASRFVSEAFRDCFELECRALLKVRGAMGLTNVWAMVPFVRTVEEGRGVIEVMKSFGLVQGENDLKIIMMCELPSNALLADQFLDIFDGFSIGSNDLTQLTLGLDRDSAVVAHLFDERNAAVKALLSMAIAACRKRGKYVGICGQGPSDHPDLAEWLLDQGIESISLNPDSVVDTWLRLAAHKPGQASLSQAGTPA
ncbi:MAG TPA: phosphoenolpyruvate synthase [Xanthomonadales bacterium]|nr:phosphoenolpyruvate synthase [Xanthomonadales bacterium]